MTFVTSEPVGKSSGFPFDFPLLKADSGKRSFSEEFAIKSVKSAA